MLKDFAGRVSRWMRCLLAVALLCGVAGLRGAGIELLINPQFNQLDPANSLKPLAWNSTVGWVAFTGAAGNDGPPSVPPNGGSGDRLLAFGDSPTVLVSQTVPVAPMAISNVRSFELEYRVTKNQQVGIYSVQAEFLNNSGTVLATLRRPSLATETAPGAWTTYLLLLSRDSSANFDQIAQVRVSIFGQQSPNVWAGHYGPFFDYVSLGAVLRTPLSVTGMSAANKEYDRTTSTTVDAAGASLVGVGAGDSVNLVSGNATANFASATVGIGKSVVVSGLTLSGTHAWKYTLTQPTLMANITAKVLTVSGLTGGGKVYDGTTAATVTGAASLVGVISEDEVTLGGTPAFAFSSAGVGTGKAVTATGYTLVGGQAVNYTLTQPTLTASITSPNQPPTEIVLSANSLAENNAVNATVGTLTATDVDAGSTHTFTLVSGIGDTDNSAFNVSGNALRLTGSADFEAKSSYSVRVRATDTGGLFFETAFTISVTDVNDAPTMNIRVFAAGGAKTTAGGFTVHTFTGPSDTFTPAASGLVEVLVVAGGGGGGGSFVGGGGGGGGVVSSATYPVNAGEPILVLVGNGGAGGFFNKRGENGGLSRFGSLTAMGGGGGGNYPGDGSGHYGGSGGGAGFYGAPGTGVSGQGFPGGAFGSIPQFPSNHGGGGGGAGGTPDSSGVGGVGVVSSISGSIVYYAGGGAAGTDDLVPLPGGLGGGGAGGQGFVNGVGGVANTGGGGGGGGGLSMSPVGGDGGSGVVIVRYTSNAIEYVDTAATDTFASVHGTLEGADMDPETTLTYGISGGTSVEGSAGSMTMTGTYGTLTVSTTTGTFIFTPNDVAINALSTSTTETFVVTVSDGMGTTMANLVVHLTGVNDRPTLKVASQVSSVPAFFTDFTSLPNNVTLGGSALLQNGEAVLTEAINSQDGTLTIAPLSPNPEAFVAEFSYRAYDGSGADGVSFNYGLLSDSLVGYPWLEYGRTDSGLVVSFIEYEGSRIEAKVNGVVLSAVNFNLMSPEYRTVRVEVDGYGLLSVSVGGQSVLASVDLGSAYRSANKSAWRFGFGARTGGLNNRHSLDSFSIEATASNLVPWTFALTEGVPGNLVFLGAPFGDVDDTQLTVTLSVTEGALTGAVSAGVSIEGTSIALSFQGSAVALNTYFATPGNVTYQGALNNTQKRVLTTTVSDGNLSTGIASTITLTAVNDAPLLSASQGSMQAIEQVAVAVDGEITVSDADNETLSSATVAVSGGFQSGEDVLGYINNLQVHGNIQGSFNATTGVLTLTSDEATATLMQWREALRTVTYLNTSENPNTLERTVTWVVNDGLSNSAAVTKALSVTAVNDVPTDIALSASSLAENNAANAIVGTLTATDVDAGSTHTFELVSGTGSTDNAAFNVSGNALRLTGSANFEAKGSYSVRIRATDNGSLTFEKTFVITVTDVNEAPTITAIADQATLEDTSTGAIAFTVGDAETAVGSLTVTATSSNLGVVAANGIALGGSGANRTITLTPVANASGPSTITVTVTDGGGSTATRSFVLTVTAVNDVPTISAIVDQTTLENTATGAIAFTVGDVETAVGSLTVTATSSDLGVVAANGIALGGSGANRTITLTPVADAMGASAITVTVADGTGGTTTLSFEVMVTAVGELLVNGQFAQLDSNAPLKPLAWESTQGWVAFTGDFQSPPYDSPAVVGNGARDKLLAFGWSPNVVVSQTVSLLPGMIEGLGSFKLAYRVVRNQQPGVYWVLAEFMNDSGSVLATLRRPESGTEEAPMAWETYPLSLSRSAVAAFDQITQVRVSLFGVTTGSWGGHYGPLFDYVSLVAVPDTNNEPTDIALSATSLAENNAANATVGTLSASDPDAGATHTFTLVNGSGDTDNAVFNVSGNSLRLTVSADFEAKSNYSVRVRATDIGGLFFEKVFAITVTDVNEAPTIAAILAQTTQEDMATGAFAVTVGDAETAVGLLTVTATSSDLGVVAAGGIALGGSGADRTITLTPVPNASGTTTITVTVTDAGGLTATRSFVLTVTAANDVPTISAIADQTTLEDTSTGAIAFTVGDVETAVGSLTVTATSSDLGVVAAGGIALGGSGASRTLTLSPVANASGTSTITVTVTDAGGASATRSFLVTVTAANDVPTISAISDQTTVEDTATGAISFTVGDVETAPGSLTVKATSSNLDVVSAGGIALGGSGANSTITLTPVANASGASTITVTVIDAGGLTATRSFALIVTPVPDVPTFEGFLLGAGLMPVVGGGGRYRLEASLGQAIAGSLPKVEGLDLASGFWFLDRLADALPGQLGDIPTAAQAAKGLVLQRATVAVSHIDRLSSRPTPQMASGVRLPEARIRVAAVGDTAKVRILVSGLPKARWRVFSREGFGTGPWRDDGILQLDGEGEGFLETSGGDASAMRFYRLVQP
jgi:VCBS repeat-containing protein